MKSDQISRLFFIDFLSVLLINLLLCYTGLDVAKPADLIKEMIEIMENESKVLPGDNIFKTMAVYQLRKIES